MVNLTPDLFGESSSRPLDTIYSYERPGTDAEKW